MGMIVRMWVVWALGWLVGLGAAVAGEPTGAPLLRLETGMHTAMIRRIATDAAGRWAVTASDDKTARIWDVASGEPVGVLRVLQDGGNEGELRAVAMSPDGTQIAVGGWSEPFNNDIYLFDRATQRLLRRISGLPNVINHLAYSPDSRWLAAGLWGQNGVRVFDHASGQEVGRDSNYGGDSYSVEFSPKASPGGLRLLSTSFDGQVRLHAVVAGRLTLLKTLHPGGGARPYSARFSPDGRWVAVGFYDSRVVQVLDGQDLSERARPEVSGVDNGDLGRVSWSADGRSLVMAGEWGVGGKRSMRRWSVGDWSWLGDVPLSGDSVMDLVALPKAAGGGWLFAGADPVWGVVTAQGQVTRRREGALADLRDQPDQLHLSADGRQLRFGYAQWGKAPYRFDTNRRALTPETASAESTLRPARFEAPELVVKDWKNNTAPTLNGQPVQLEQHEASRSLAIAPDVQGFALGADWRLRFFDRTGKERWQQPVPGAVWAVNISADARWVVAAYADGTIRWHRLDNGKEVLAFFPHADRQRWVLWTPEGFFDASSPDAEDLIGYHLNRGKDREGEFISAAQLRDRFYNPALVTARLTPDGDRLMAAAVQRLGDVTALLENARNLPPQIEIVSVGDTVSGEEDVEVTFRLTDLGGGVGAVQLYVNGSPVKGRQTGLSHGSTYTHKFPLVPGTHKIQATAKSRGGVESVPTAPLTAIISGPKRAGTLHILAVGVETYQDPKLRLQNSAADAERLAAEIARRAEPVFPQRVAKPVVLKNEQATLAGISAAFDTMSRRFQPEDTLVVFLAGHGEAAIGQYTYLPWDFKRGAPGAVGEGLNEARLLDMLQRSPARTLLLLDTCDAGGMVDMLEKSYLRLEQRAIIGASRRGELAREGYKGHGVFTAGLLQVINRSDGEEVTPLELLPQVERVVKRISGEMGGSYQQRVSGFVGRANFPVVKR